MNSELNSSHSPGLQTIHRELDRYIGSAFKQEGTGSTRLTFVIDQFFLLSDTSVPQELNNPIPHSLANFKFLPYLSRLNYLSKITILFLACGPQLISRAIKKMDWEPLLHTKTQPNLPSLSATLAFSREVSFLTDGVIPAFQLNAYRILRMRMMSCIDSCLQTRHKMDDFHQ